MNADYTRYPTNSIFPTSSGDDTTAKIGAKRKRVPGTPSRRHQLPEDIPWTAARCNRLLRAITSRIQILRRLSENNFADKAVARQSPARRKIVFHPNGNEGGRVSPEGVESARSRLAALPALESPSKESNDPDWLPDDGRKPNQRTYAGRGGKARKVKIEEPSLPVRSSGTADFRSPFIKRVLRTDATESPTDVITDTPRRLTGQKIVLDPKTHSERALRTLLEALDKVLSTTAAPQHGRRTGAKSLGDMCLHKVPNYIDFEQKFAYDEQEYDFDATETIYVNLETLGNGGWDGLREVARAHAVKMIADAMDERSWPVESLDRLLDVCEKNQAVAEGQQILRSWFAKSEGRASNRMARLLAWSKILDSTGFFFSTLRDMLECGRLHMHEFTECPSVWQDLVKALARKSSRSEAAHFLEAYTLACIRDESNMANGIEDMKLHDRLKRDEILQNVMVLVTALSWTSDDSTSISTGAAHCLFTHVHRMAINASLPSTPHVQKDGHATTASRQMLHSTEPLLMSSILLQALNASAATDHLKTLPTETIWNCLLTQSRLPLQSSSQQALRAARAQFVCSTAKCIAHISQVSANGFIKDVSSSLLLLAERTPEQDGALLKQLAVDVAAAWANYRSDNESYIFADEIEQAAFYGASTKHFLHSRGSVQKPVEYRWEETIEEWVAMTPLSDARPQKFVYSQIGDGFAQPELRKFDAELVRAGAEHTIVLGNSGGLYEYGWPSTTNPDNQGSMQGTFADNNPVADRSPHSTPYPIDGIQTEALEELTGSPLQAKASRQMPGQPEDKTNAARQITAASRCITAAVSVNSPASAVSHNELALETPARPFDESSPISITVAFRTRPPVAQMIRKSDLLIDRDELAMTPAKPHIDVQLETVVANPVNEDTLVQHTGVERDELAATPARAPAISTRQLRSAKQSSTTLLDNAKRIGMFDELAMTPAQRVTASPRKTRVPRQTIGRATRSVVTTEHDELGVTPQKLSIARSRSTKAPGTKNRRKADSADVVIFDEHLNNPTQMTEKGGKIPLGARSGNARTAVKARKGGASDDELGL